MYGTSDCVHSYHWLSPSKIWGISWTIISFQGTEYKTIIRVDRLDIALNFQHKSSFLSHGWCHPWGLGVMRIHSITRSLMLTLIKKINTFIHQVYKAHLIPTLLSYTLFHTLKGQSSTWTWPVHTKVKSSITEPHSKLWSIG